MKGCLPLDIAESAPQNLRLRICIRFREPGPGSPKLDNVQTPLQNLPSSIDAGFRNRVRAQKWSKPKFQPFWAGSRLLGAALSEEGNILE